MTVDALLSGLGVVPSFCELLGVGEVCRRSSRRHGAPGQYVARMSTIGVPLVLLVVKRLTGDIAGEPNCALAAAPADRLYVGVIPRRCSRHMGLSAPANPPGLQKCANASGLTWPN